MDDVERLARSQTLKNLGTLRNDPLALATDRDEVAWKKERGREAEANKRRRALEERRRLRDEETERALSETMAGRRARRLEKAANEVRDRDDKSRGEWLEVTRGRAEISEKSYFEGNIHDAAPSPRPRNDPRRGRGARRDSPADASTSQVLALVSRTQKLKTGWRDVVEAEMRKEQRRAVVILRLRFRKFIPLWRGRAARRKLKWFLGRLHTVAAFRRAVMLYFRIVRCVQGAWRRRMLRTRAELRITTLQWERVWYRPAAQKSSGSDKDPVSSERSTSRCRGAAAADYPRRRRASSRR